MIATTCTQNDGQNKGSCVLPQYVSDITKKLIELGETKMESQRYETANFTITVTYTPDV